MSVADWVQPRGCLVTLREQYQAHLHRWWSQQVGGLKSTVNEKVQCQNTVGEWSCVRRFLTTCKKTQETKTRVLSPQFLKKHVILLGLCCHAPPRCGRWEWVYFRLFTTTGYQHVFICLHAFFFFFAIFSLSLGLDALLIWLLLTLTVQIVGCFE